MENPELQRKLERLAVLEEQDARKKLSARRYFRRLDVRQDAYLAFWNLHASKEEKADLEAKVKAVVV